MPCSPTAPAGVLGRGRNQRFAGGLLAHAELEALAALPAAKDRARDARLYTTLHPCPMCLGAAVVARIAELHVGAHDPTWLGIERLPELNDEVARRWPPVHGPLPGPVGEWLAVLPALNTSGALVRAMAETAPHRAALARLVAARYAGDLPEKPEDALAAAWDLLT